MGQIRPISIANPNPLSLCITLYHRGPRKECIHIQFITSQRSLRLRKMTIYVHEKNLLHKKSCTQHTYKYRTMPLGPKSGKLIYFITFQKTSSYALTHRISRLKQEK